MINEADRRQDFDIRSAGVSVNCRTLDASQSDGDERSKDRGAIGVDDPRLTNQPTVRAMLQQPEPRRYPPPRFQRWQG